MKIMVVDQYVLVREGIIRLLKGQPDLEIVGDGKIGSEMVTQALLYEPDIVLMGANLFEAGGREMMKMILTKCPATAFIILASHDNVELLLEVVRNGARGFLPKNISESVLIQSLHAVQRGELAISRKMMATVVSELRRMSKAIVDSENDIVSTLTFRELQVLRLLATEASNSEIARQLFISGNTVRVHVHSILEKLQARNRREAAKFAQRVGVNDNGHRTD